MTLRLLLVRHGLSSFNLQNRIQGRNDLSTLTEEGTLQAKKARLKLADLSIDSVYSSPLQRAADTTKELLKDRNSELKIIYDKNLLEVDLGQWSGLTSEEVQSNYPEQFGIWKKNPNALVLTKEDGSQYKPIKDLMDQAEEFIANLLNRHDPIKEENVLIVGHNAILRCIILQLIGKPENGFRRIRLDNASISVIKINSGLKKGSNNTQIESLNITSHLGSPFPKQKSNARIILVRHGETNWNKEGRFQGQIDIPLNDNGKKQANAANKFLRNTEFSKVFSSSMSRPLETAKIILKNNSNIKIKCIEELIEIGHGQWEGKLESEIKNSWGGLLKEWQVSPEKVQMPDGETIQDVWDRAVGCWMQICDSLSSTDTALVVAHDAVNKTIICNLLGLSPSDIWMIKQGNGGITVIDIPDDEEGLAIITSLNITSHLGGLIDCTAQGAL
ncbi:MULTISPECIES: histidine phosphatase family protein [Prochlorococcus]|uniref:histidine phosphatase family protein n=1 Tax=Prochlorococcus TaxID=1218 RepID=UPI0005337D8E|nr:MULTISPECIES: histidine phosphatase family protein [Prochlorococcus]KGG12876.1 Phosphoglycerate mutase [Prochlorococcus sp. MIT 0601]